MSPMPAMRAVLPTSWLRLAARGPRPHPSDTQFFSVLDAMYGSNLFKHLANSPWVDYLIMDSNFKVGAPLVHHHRVATARRGVPSRCRSLPKGAAGGVGQRLWLSCPAVVERLAGSHLTLTGPPLHMQTPYGTLMNVDKLRLYVSAAMPYNKPTYFEAAVEVYKNLTVSAGGLGGIGQVQDCSLACVASLSCQGACHAIVLQPSSWQ